MALHPMIQEALDLGAGLPAYSTLPIAQARAQAMLPYQTDKAPFPVGGVVRDLSIPGPAGAIAARVYTPAASRVFPLLVFFHGSGFVVLGLDSHDELCRRLCVGAACVVVSVDYRLAPEHKFPAASDDCLAATSWARAHAGDWGADPARVAVAGDSAGACLAAVTALRLRDAGSPALKAQLLFYPVTDYPTVLTESYRSCANGYGLTQAGMVWFWEQYLRAPADGEHPHASPLRMESPAGMPPAYVVVAQYDVLRDEGEAYARRLHAAGVSVQSRRALGMNHGFLKYAGVIDEAGAELDAACHWLAGTLRD